MIAVVQRVTHSSVSIGNSVTAEIEKGLLVLLGIAHEDSMDDVEWLTKKITGLRIFSDSEGKMNLSLNDIGGDVLIVSQFTLHASTKKGNRPSFIEAARPEVAIPLYELFIKEIEKLIAKEVKTGVFGADMKVSLTNDGPVTIIIDSKNRK